MAWAHAPGRAAARGARAICNWDEDALTMAVEAARSCVAASTGGSLEADAAPQSIVFCSTTAPFADRDHAVMLSPALAFSAATETLNLGASLRARSSWVIT